MNIKIITLDKVTDKFTKDAVAEYSKRLSKYCKLIFKEYKNETQLLKELTDKSFVIHINSEGKLVSSEELADKFSELALTGKSDIVFIITSSHLSEEILNKIDFNMAISRMDINFSVLLVILYEQIYRVYRINCNEPYHK